jgi:hypothetical protein
MVWLKNKNAGATVGKSVKWAKQFFRAAARKKIIPENPFEDVKPPSMANEARKRFIDRAVTARVRPSWPPTIPCTSSAPGSATRNALPPSIIFR